MTLRFTPKPTLARPYLLDGKRVGLAEAARILDVGLATIVRHTHGAVIDVEAIHALVPGVPLKKSIAQPRPIRLKRHVPTYAFADRTLTLQEWSDLAGIPLDLLRQRVNVYGWEIGRALSQPPATASVDSRRRNQNRKVIARIASAFHEART